MNPKFTQSEIVDFLGCKGAPAAEAVEVLRVSYCDALTLARIADTGQPITVVGWVYELSCCPGGFVKESRLRKRTDQRKTWDAFMAQINQPMRIRA